MRPRIRTLKPENWHDERVASLSWDARLLRDVLVTMADDEGRFKARPVVIIGFGYPDDDVSPRRIRALLAEIADTGLILLYEHDGRAYGAFRHWRKHQVINRPTASVIPAPPDAKVVADNAIPAKCSRNRSDVAPGSLTDNSVNETGALPSNSGSAHHSRAVRDPIRSDPIHSDPPAARAREAADWFAERHNVDREHVIGAAVSFPAVDPMDGVREAHAWLAADEWRTGPAKTVRMAFEHLAIKRRARQRAEINAAGDPVPCPNADEEWWSAFRAELEGRVDTSAMALWLSGLHPHRQSGDSYVVGAAPGHADWITERYGAILDDAAAATATAPDRISVEVCGGQT